MSRNFRFSFGWFLFLLFGGIALGIVASPGTRVPGRITVVDQDDYPPYLFRDENGKLRGITVDTWREWEQTTGVRVDLIGTSWERTLGMLEKGEADVVATIFHTPFREKSFELTRPYDKVRTRIFFHRSLAGISDASSLKGFVVGVISEDTAEEWLAREGVKDVHTYRDFPSLIQGLLKGEVRIFVADEPVSLYYLARNRLDREYLGSAPVYESSFCRAVKKGNQALAEFVDQGFGKVPPGRIGSIMRKWKGERLSDGIPVNSYLMAVGVAALVLLFLLAWNASLHRLVKVRTRTLQQAFDELARSEASFRRVVESSRDIIYVLDLEGNILSLNPAFDLLLGHSAKDWVGNKFYGIIHPEDRQRAIDLHEAVLRGEAPPLIELRCFNSVGSVAICELLATPILREGSVLGALVVARDVTYRRNTEEALADEKERLAVILRSIVDAVFMTTVEGNVIYMNGAAEEMCRMELGAAINLPLEQVLHIRPEKPGKNWPTPVERVLEVGGMPSQARVGLLEDRHGRHRVVSENGAPIHDRDNRITGIVIVVQDITDLRRAESETLNMTRLESLGILAGGIAHDFNNILTGIMGSLSLALYRVPEDSPVRDWLGEAERASLRAQELTRQLLTFSKGGTPIMRSLHLGELLRESVTFSARGSQVRCDFDLDENLWSVEADEGQISQVISNIAVNAVQAMKGGGSLKVAARNLVLLPGQDPSLEAGRYVELSFTDTGSGIPREQLLRIFDPYYTTKSTGSGLGLAVSHSIIRRHGGRIWAESEPEVGTTFHVLLQASERTVRSETARPVQAIVKGGGRILVMDDEPTVRNVATEMLRQLGYNTVESSGGAEAVELYRQALSEGNRFSAVILDLTVPGGMGGEEAIQLLGKLDPSVRAVASSGYSNSGILARYREYGFVDILPKPFRLEELAGIMAKVHESTETIGKEC